MTTRRRPGWWDDMRFGTPITRDSEAGTGIALEDQVLRKLLRGPVMESDFPPMRQKLYSHIHELNKMLEKAGRHVVSEPVTVQSAHGLALKARRYHLERV